MPETLSNFLIKWGIYKLYYFASMDKHIANSAVDNFLLGRDISFDDDCLASYLFIFIISGFIDTVK